MRKLFRFLLISILSLIGISILAVSIAIWIVFTPERITPIVRKQASKFLTCESGIGEVELTFFSTYPDIGLKVRNLALINPVPGAQSDTLVQLDEFTGVIDSYAWRKRRELRIVGLELNRGSINVFTDSLGNTNYDIFSGDSTAETEADSGTVMPLIDIKKVVLNDVNLNYLDLAAKLSSVIRGLDARMEGFIGEDSISGRLEISRSGISLAYAGEKYLDHAEVNLDIPVDIVPSRQYVNLKNASLSVNKLALEIDGTLENDTLNRALSTNIRYNFSGWPAESIMALVPPSLLEELEGIEGKGLLSSEGTIKGMLGDSVMPLMDIHLVVDNAELDYDEFPLPLHDIKGDFRFVSDLKNDAISYLKINRLEAGTPRSDIKASGTVKHLFSDIRCDLSVDNNLLLDEFAVLMPDSLDLKLHGRASGKLKAVFTLGQLEKMEIDKMNFSGTMSLRDFSAEYDSMMLQTSLADINFDLLNRKASRGKRDFVYADISTDEIRAGKPGSYDVYVRNAGLSLETSDIRDTTRIPDVLCYFTIDTLYAGLDTMSVALTKPSGKIDLSPRDEAPDQPRIMLTYAGELTETRVGQNSASLKEISLDTDILNDNSQEDIFLRWLASGYVNMYEGIISLAGFTYPIAIPSIRLNFEPEKIRIDQASMILDKSDFRLAGYVNNVLSYFRGDSILKGQFLFESDETDIEQIMALTNGLGSRDVGDAEAVETNLADSTPSGPYMVPLGMDISLSTNIKRATMGIDTARNINGEVRVKDGVLVLDGLNFRTPAARMQLTAMYRTPRKNHLYAGIDYHMLDVEIEQLLTMIPDIDSLMPMLRSFAGKGEFHLAVETYLDSLYNIKKSTLRGASYIRGNNLTLLDGETFSEISKKLRFSKKAENKVDSLSAEFTIFRNEIDIYPFLIVMDRYKAVIAGRHNFDMSFNYHVSIVDSPVPVKLGVDIKGNMDDYSVNLAPCRYAEFYRPVSRKAVESKQLELRQLIRDVLTQKVRAEDNEDNDAGK